MGGGARGGYPFGESRGFGAVRVRCGLLGQVAMGRKNRAREASPYESESELSHSTFGLRSGLSSVDLAKHGMWTRPMVVKRVHKNFHGEHGAGKRKAQWYEPVDVGRE